MKVRLSILAAFVTILSFGCCQAQSTNVLNMKNETIFPQIFPQGDRLPEEFSRYFTGQAYLASISNNEALGTHISNVTFEPGCRNNWHIHHATQGGGQMLIGIAGRGWYQEEGKAAVEILPGTVIHIPANVKHWHGAAANSWFAHLAFELSGENTSNEWLEPVTDEEYDKIQMLP